MSRHCISAFEENLVQLVRDKDWKQVLELGINQSLEEKSRFLWAWPSEKCLKFIENEVMVNKIDGILSIGCGSGLLEWLIQESCGIPVNGLELDCSWWSSIYSPKTFIPLQFTTNEITPQFLQNCAKFQRSLNTDLVENNIKFALLFCYFNNHEAFMNYLRNFSGNIVIIIGPGEGKGVHTNPTPFKPNIETIKTDNFVWKLLSWGDIGDEINFVALYKKCYI